MSRHSPRQYDWLGYGLWFGFGAIIGGIPFFVFHVALETATMSAWQIIGLLTVCCLAGGLWEGRKHRRQWERENAAASILEEIGGYKADDFRPR